MFTITKCCIRLASIHSSSKEKQKKKTTRTKKKKKDLSIGINREQTCDASADSKRLEALHNLWCKKKT